MISSLIDELRKSEDEWNRSNMFELARMCREAADTILQLRDDLQRANTENAKLEARYHKAQAEAWPKLEARYHKEQAEAWQRRARQLEAESQDLGSRAEALQDRIGWYRARYHELKDENRRLRAELAGYTMDDMQTIKNRIVMGDY